MKGVSFNDLVFEGTVSAGALPSVLFLWAGWIPRCAGKRALLKAALVKFAALNDVVAAAPVEAPADAEGLGASLQKALENALGKKKEFVSVDMADKLKSLGLAPFFPLATWPPTNAVSLVVVLRGRVFARAAGQRTCDEDQRAQKERGSKSLRIRGAVKVSTVGA